jgi:hypothetical protein
MQKKDFKIENSLYPEKHILESIADFEGFSISFISGILTISGETGEEVEEIFHEFMNYVLAKRNESL